MSNKPHNSFLFYGILLLVVGFYRIPSMPDMLYNVIRGDCKFYLIKDTKDFQLSSGRRSCWCSSTQRKDCNCLCNKVLQID